jgi:hypothetical protein
MHRVRVTAPRYQQSRGYAGQVGEVIGHWGPETNESGRDGFLVEFPDGNVVGIAEDEVEAVAIDEPSAESSAPGRVG